MKMGPGTGSSPFFSLFQMHHLLMKELPQLITCLSSTPLLPTEHMCSDSLRFCLNLNHLTYDLDLGRALLRRNSAPERMESMAEALAFPGRQLRGSSARKELRFNCFNLLRISGLKGIREALPSCQHFQGCGAFTALAQKRLRNE